MNLYKKFTGKSKRLFSLFLPSKMKESANEKKYYKQLFINNQYWNKPNANEEEELRWNIIQKFITTNIINSREPLTVLDLGCGRGWLTNLLSQYGEVIGIEPVKSVVEYGKSLYPGLNLMSGSTKTLLKKGYEQKFDLIVCSEVIEHVKDNKKLEFVNEIGRLLKSDGFCIITTPRKEAEIEWQRYSDPNQPIEDWITEKELEKLFVKHRFERKLLDRFSIKPSSNAPAIEIYQLWLFKKSL